MLIKRKHKRTRNIEKIFDIYLLSYKKYKYWLSIYYILTLIIFLLLSKYEDWNIFEEFPRIERIVEYSDFMKSISDVPGKTALSEVINQQIQYHVSPTPWIEVRTKTDNYLAQTETFLNKLDSKLDSIYSDEIEEIIKNDKRLIYALISRRDSLIQSRIGNTSLSQAEINVIVKKEKNNFTSQIRDSLLVFHDVFLSKEFSDKIYKAFGVKSEDLSLTIDDYD